MNVPFISLQGARSAHSLPDVHFIFSSGAGRPLRGGHTQISNPKILAQINVTPDEINPTTQF